MLKHQKWINKNTHSLKGKTVLIIGGTGSIGRKVINYLLGLDAYVIVAARNITKAKELFNEKTNLSIEYLDISDLNSIDAFQLQIDKKYPKIDVLINNAGVLNSFEKTSKQGYEMHFAANALGNYYLAKKLLFDLKDNAKIINTSSISYNFNKINFNDFEGIFYHNSIKRYGLTKRIMTFNTLWLKDSLKETNLKINLVHPGICATELFTKNKSVIYKIFYPMMKLVFHNEDKAALSIIKGIFTETKFNEWIGPRFLNIWGYPKTSLLNKKVCDLKMITKVNEITEDLIKKHLIKEY